MVRGSGPVVAAAIAMLEQQKPNPNVNLRRVGAVSVLPRATPEQRLSTSDVSTTDSEESSEDRRRLVAQISEENCQLNQEEESSLEESTVKLMNAWTHSTNEDVSLTSGDSTSASDIDDNNRDDHNTTGCEEDFQWIQNCDKQLEMLENSSPTKDNEELSNGNITDTYNKESIKSVTYRNKTSSGSLDRQRRSNRKERDNKSKSSTAYQRFQSPSRPLAFTDDNIKFNNGCRNMCYNCSSSCQDLPEFRDLQRQHDRKDPHCYGSTPGLDCHWSQQSYGCRDFYYPCQHRNYSPYLPYDQFHPYRYFSKPNHDVDEHIRRLESDKESLTLQVTVLHEQIDAQSEKISDLEKILDDKKKQLSAAEDILHREMLTRSSLETQKLEFLAIVSELKRQQAALERENCELRDRLAEERRRNKPPIAPRSSPFPTSTPTNNQALSRGTSPSPSPVPNSISPRKIIEHHDDINIQNQQQTPLPPYRRAADQQYSSLPRQSTLTSETPRKGVAFGRSFHLIRHIADRSSSVPNLAETETVVINDISFEVDGHSYSPQQSPSPSLQVKKPHGIKKIFGRMKRSGSGNLDDLPGDGEFKRGGIRATAGGRLGWSSQNHTKSDLPFAEWNTDALCDWLMDLGLESCVAEAKNWIKNGAQLLAASTHEIEKELGLKHPLHRKKLHLALHCFRGLPGDNFLIPAGHLDTTWVLRWLDDAGLPQHKDAFLAARVDGRLLHRLTVDDLAALHVTSVLHVSSIRTGIQVLRTQNFEPNCLIRRSNPDEPSTEGTQDVALWTNHRVMEWLRVVDLAEYAPNLRGSGVHGGLLVYEPRFTGELLASLLSIPPGKTLLRRHLMTHFKELLGRDVIQEKREAEASLGYVPLTTTAKMKIVKKSQFTLKRKKSKSELDYGELVCALSQSRAEEQAGDSLSVSGASKTTQSQGDVFHESQPSINQNGVQDKTGTDRNSTV